MTVFDFGVQILTEAGDIDPRFSYEGHPGFVKTGLGQDVAYATYPIVAEATCQLSARGGCLSGSLEIVGSGIDWPKIEDGQFVRFLWNRFEPSSLFYSGRIARGADRAGTGTTHKYKLEGAWNSLDWYPIVDGGLLGTEGEVGSTGSAELCIRWYLANVVGITGIDTTRDIIDIGTIDTDGAVVKALSVTPDTKPKEFFETLEFMATGAEVADPPRFWIAGVDHNRLFYFKPLAEGGTPALTVQHGDDHAFRPLVDWTEQVITRLPPGRVRIWGGSEKTNDQLFSNPISYGRSVQKPHTVYAPTLQNDEDMALMATGWFRKFGKRIAIVSNLSYIAEEPPRPWDGYVLFKRVNEDGDVVDQPLLWDSADFALSQGPVIRIAIGDEQEPRTSRNQGLSPVRRMIRDWAGVEDPIEISTGTGGGGGGGGGTTVFGAPHSHRGFYDQGYAGMLSGGR